MRRIGSHPTCNTAASSEIIRGVLNKAKAASSHKLGGYFT